MAKLDSSLIAQVSQHWKEFRPQLWRELKAAGRLPGALLDALRRTQSEMDQLEQHGMTTQDAWEMVRQEYLFLPPQQNQSEPVASPGARNVGPLIARNGSEFRRMIEQGTTKQG